MEKLSKKRAVELAGVSVYRLNGDIEKGRLKRSSSGGVCAQSLSKNYKVADEMAASSTLAQVTSNSSFEDFPDKNASASKRESSPEPLHLRLMAKLEALLSLAERHRLMIEQQRRNIGMLKTINQRQERELQHLRRELNESNPVEIQSWRRLFERFSGPHRT